MKRKYPFLPHLAICTAILIAPCIAPAEPFPRPTLSLLQAATIADRELQARGMAEQYYLGSVALVRGRGLEDSFYMVSIDPVDPGKDTAGGVTARKSRRFQIDMQGVIKYFEVESRRVRVQQ